MTLDITEAFLAKIAGWETIKRARSLVAADKVLSSLWANPLLKGVVQEGSATYQAGLVIKGTIDIENLCKCRESRNWGVICLHSVAVGLHYIKTQTPTPDAGSTCAPESQKNNSQPTQTVTQPAPLAPPKRCLRMEPDGEPLALHIVLPPNLREACGRGKITLCLEAQWYKGRCPLNAIPRTQGVCLTEQDATLLDALESLTGGEVPGVIQITSRQFADLLPRLVGHPGIHLGRGQSVEVGSQPGKPQLQAKLDEKGEIHLSMPNNANTVFCAGSDKLWLYDGRQFLPVNLPQTCQGLTTSPRHIPRSQVPQFLNQDLALLENTCQLEANFRLEDFTLNVQTPEFHLRLAGGIAHLEAWLWRQYGNQKSLLAAAPETDLFLPDPANTRAYTARDWPAEKAAQARLLRYGFSAPDAQGRMLLKDQNAILNFFAREYPKLQREWKVELEERLQRSTQQHLERIEPRFAAIPSGQEWFDLQISYQTQSREQVAPADIQRLLRSGQSYQRLTNGKFALLDTEAADELQEVLCDCAPEQHSQGFRLPNSQAGYLAATLREKGGWNLAAPGPWQERIKLLDRNQQITCPPLGNLEEVLRPYQKTGVGWVSFLRQNRFGGILADEMGLGKTLQTLAFVQALRLAGNQSANPDAGGETPSQPSNPVLVVCPTSLVFNWVAEARRFTPELKVLAIEGPDRERLFARIPEADLVITSYALIRRDTDLYRPFEFDLAVLDEAQHIKNRQSQNAQAVKAIRARQRLVLTGTPLENSVLDLWSIFDFLMPGYLGSAKDFRERYEMPIVKERSQTAQARLARRVRPFVLRRLKSEVVRELPAKIEQISLCDLSPAQASIYRQVLQASRQEIIESVNAQGVAKSRMMIFTALLRLRQICCDLRLLKLSDPPSDGNSGKLDLFNELLEEILDGGHKVLVFSQFVSMLQLIKDSLAERELNFCYLDGSTTDREDVVNRFQRQSDIPIFLISLKAGGVGLNLTAADTVIHFDPWWNPAIEEQAIGRAHRIGQTRVVTSYKLITRGTVEEKILQLQARKRELFKAALGDESELGNALDWNEIEALLAD